MSGCRGGRLYGLYLTTDYLIVFQSCSPQTSFLTFDLLMFVTTFEFVVSATMDSRCKIKHAMKVCLSYAFSWVQDNEDLTSQSTTEKSSGNVFHS